MDPSSLFDHNLLSPAVAAPFQATARAIAHRDTHPSCEACATSPNKDCAFLSRLRQCQLRGTSGVRIAHTRSEKGIVQGLYSAAIGAIAAAAAAAAASSGSYDGSIVVLVGIVLIDCSLFMMMQLGMTTVGNRTLKKYYCISIGI